MEKENIYRKIRKEIGQISSSFKERNNLKKLKNQIAAINHISFDKKIVWKRSSNELWAITVVKDELDILPSTINHLLSQGIDNLIILDNMSTDGTHEYLKDLAKKNKSVFVASDTNPAHHQSEKMSWLAYKAWLGGARWIIPFDGDEFWYAPDLSLKEFFLKNDPDVVYANFHHTVPTSPHPTDIRNSELVMDMANSFPGKVAFKSHPLAIVGPGNHYTSRFGKTATPLEIVHVQYRGPEQLKRKFKNGLKSSEKTGHDLTWFSPHWVAGSRLDEREIAEVWENISSGLPEPRIEFKAEGPMLKGKFLQMNNWNIIQEDK